jgi:hypothetical protein
MKNLFKDTIDIVFWTLFLFLLLATFVVFTINANSWAVQILAACLGAVITIIATRLLLSKQSEIDSRNQEREDEIKKNQELYNAKLKVYSDFVSEMYNALRDGHITSDELQELRTKLFATVGFYAGEYVLMEIHKQMESDFGSNESINQTNNIDVKMPFFFSKITGILQDDTKIKEKSNDDSKNIKAGDKVIVNVLWNKFQIIINALKEQEEQEIENKKKEKAKEDHEKMIDEKQDNLSINNLEKNKENGSNEEHNYLEQQTWHFNAWDGTQFKQLEELGEAKEYELSLVEYGEYWRTNLVKQVSEGDIIMLFRRGGYGYVGAFKAIGRRVFDFEKGEEEIQYFDDRGRKTVKKDDELFKKDVEKYDIYGSMKDGATLCSNLIVECIAYVPEGVGNPGGVYRRTISRYDSHYAWLLKKRFQEKGLWLEQ